MDVWARANDCRAGALSTETGDCLVANVIVRVCEACAMDQCSICCGTGRQCTHRCRYFKRDLALWSSEQKILIERTKQKRGGFREAAPDKLFAVLWTGTIPEERVPLIAAGLDQAAIDALCKARIIEADGEIFRTCLGSLFPRRADFG